MCESVALFTQKPLLFCGSTRWKSGRVWKSEETLLISSLAILFDFGALCMDVISCVCAYRRAEWRRGWYSVVVIA